MPTYHVSFEYTQTFGATMQFEAEDDDHAEKLVKENLPPVENLKILDIVCVSAADSNPERKLN